MISNYTYEKSQTYNSWHFAPNYVRENPILIQIESVDENFDIISPAEIVRGSVKLRQTLCSENYFLWGGCNASQLQFEICANRFINNPPGGKIRLKVIPTVWNGDKRTEILTDEAVNLFTGYIEVADKTAIPGNWKITAYDRLYRVRNTNIVAWLQKFLAAHKTEGTHISWYDMANVIQTTILDLGGDNCPEEWTKNIWYPDNHDISAENGVDLLREFCFMTQRFGILDGDGAFNWVNVLTRDDSYNTKKYFCLNIYDPSQLNYNSGHVWQPKFFVSEPRTNIFYTTGETTEAEDYYNNIYTIKSSLILGDSDWIRERYECDEYGTPNQKYSAKSMPPGLFDTSNMCLSDNEIYYQQEYRVTALMDPTIPMGSQLIITNGDSIVVESYIMDRTIKFSSAQTIECTCSAYNSPYNSVVPEYDAVTRCTKNKVDELSGKMAYIADGSSLTHLRAHKILSKSDYSALQEKRADTLYYVYDDGSTN